MSELVTIPDPRPIDHVFPIISEEVRHNSSSLIDSKVDRNLSEDARNWLYEWLFGLINNLSSSIINELSYYKQPNSIKIYRALRGWTINDYKLLPYFPLQVGKNVSIELKWLTSWSINENFC